jgi:hypothetical protein
MFIFLKMLWDKLVLEGICCDDLERVLYYLYIYIYIYILGMYYIYILCMYYIYKYFNILKDTLGQIGTRRHLL